MRDEYDIENLNPRKNPYSKRLKKQVTINIDCDTISFEGVNNLVSLLFFLTRIYVH